MKKSSKLVSLVLAMLMTVSCFSCISFASASAVDDTKVYFEVPTLEAWGTANSVYCHIYHVYGDHTDFPAKAWGSKSEKAAFNKTTGIASYDIDSKLATSLRDGNDYGLLFCTKEQSGAEHQTGNVTLSKECYGGTVYVTGNLTENTEDGQKMDYEAKWRGDLGNKYGPKLGITSKGVIVNDFLPVNQPEVEETLVAQFFANWGVINASLITKELVTGIITDSRINVTAQAAYDKYVELFGAQAGTGNYPTLEYVYEMLGVDDVPEPATTEEPTTEEPTTEEPTTEEPTTEEPTTEEPTTEEPTTEEPATEEPTTIPAVEGDIYGDVNNDKDITIDDASLIQKAAIDLVEFTELQNALADVNADNDVNIIDVTYIQKYLADYNYDTKLVGTAYNAEPVNTYVVAGMSALCNGVEWDGTASINQMQKDGDVYTITFADVQPSENLQFKVVENGTEWIGDAAGNNYSFKVSEACDVTITFDPATRLATYAGAGVEEVQFNLEALRAVGNGEEGSAWLNGVTWEPDNDANLMTEKDGVYTLTMTGVEAYDNYQIKFAANGTWADSWGIGKDENGDPCTYTAGSTIDAVYDGGNITLVVGNGEEDTNTYTVTCTVDLTGFDYASKTGGKITIDVKEEKPEPPVSNDTYIVAGTDNVFGVSWDGNASVNQMTYVDGVYVLTLEDVDAVTGQCKIVKNSTEWIGDATGNNITFRVNTPGTVTITYVPETGEIIVDGDDVTRVTELNIEKIEVVGNGDGTWLNNVAWKTDSNINVMEKVSDNVYQFVMTGVEGNSNAQFKFAANDSWNDNWGGVFAGFDVVTEASYNSLDNITLVVGGGDDDESTYTITITLDLTKFDYTTKTGATFTVTQTAE